MSLRKPFPSRRCDPTFLLRRLADARCVSFGPSALAQRNFCTAAGTFFGGACLDAERLGGTEE